MSENNEKNGGSGPRITISIAPPAPVARRLPFMPLREVVVFPGAVSSLFVGRDLSIRAIETAMAEYDRKIFLVLQKDPEQEKPSREELYPVGTVSRILQLLRLPDGTVKVLFEGLYRATCEELYSKEHNLEGIGEGAIQMAHAKPFGENDRSDPEAEIFMRALMESLEDYAKLNKRITPEILQSVGAIATPGQMADLATSHTRLDYARKQEILEIAKPLKRIEKVLEFLESEVTSTGSERNVRNRVKVQMERNQREYYLSEQIKAIYKELGRDEDPQAELLEMEKKLLEKPLTDEAREKALRELKRLRQMSPTSSEYTVARNYVDWIIDLPWNALKETNIDIAHARAVLDKDHYGLEKPKERILEYLAVQKLSNKLKGPILCFVGPPGVGKTSLAKSVATATGREFVRLSLGGVRDEAEIRGHRRTYVGALPGKIIQSLKKVKYNNPLFCLDEIDKMTADFRGDPSSALLEVLDPEQNCSFGDHYLDLDYDLSQVFFITTANNLHSIPLPLQDRMEIIRLSGYLETEKRHIAKDFLLPKQLEANGLKPENLRLSDNALLEVIRNYTREAGVRNLERELATICRKSAMRVVEKNDLEMQVNVTGQNLSQFLGIKKYRYGEKEGSSKVGVCTGLAYTEMGGDILMVETAIMPGTGKVSTTGKLGEVMTESAQAALSYVRSRAHLFGLKHDFNKEIDIHVHVPEGATPKDGPSAGITLATSLVSAMLGIPVRNSVAMTGEITLRGRVLPIGGLREKLLAAHRAQISTVLVPKDNEKDLKEVPAEILKGLKIVLVENVDEVLPLALEAGREDIFSGPDGGLRLYHSLKNQSVTLEEGQGKAQ